jgi:hypothetical protein
MAFGEGDFDLEDLFNQADERMYEDKKAKKRLAAAAGEIVPERT